MRYMALALHLLESFLHLVHCPLDVSLRLSPYHLPDEQLEDWQDGHE